MQRRPEPLQPVPPPGAAQGALREAEADQRLRARHGHVRHHRHGARERALVRRGLHQGQSVSHSSNVVCVVVFVVVVIKP